MKCWKCGSHMTKYGSYARCDHCGRTVGINTVSRSSSKGDDEPSLGGAIVFAGLASLFAMATTKLVEKDDRAVSSAHHVSREKRSFFKKTRLFFRWIFYSIIACLFVFMGIGLILFGKDRSPDSMLPSILIAIIGILFIWSGALVFWLKNKAGLSLGNILGSVILNLICKVAGILVAFGNITILNDYSTAFRIAIGGCLFLSGHFIYKKIRDS